MVAIRRKKKSSGSERLALLGKLFVAACFVWTMVAFFIGTGIDHPPIIDSLTNKVSGGKSAVSDGNGVRGATAVKTEDVDKLNGDEIQPQEDKNAKPIRIKPGNVHGVTPDMLQEFDIPVKDDAPRIKPSKPLRQTNAEIIATAPSVGLEFVDVSNNNEEHPHEGALDEDENPGYRHDEKALRNDPPAFQITRSEANCDNHDGNYQMLTEKVFVDITSHEAREREAESKSGKPRAKLFCMVYTIEKNHEKIPSIRETWGQKCDGFIVASNKTDKKLGTVNIPHEGPEEYGNIWQKVRSIWSYVYDNYYEDYDWFHIGGDDLYVIVENMRLYLESDEVQLAANGGDYLPNDDEMDQIPLFLGRRFAEQGNYERLFNSGGSGYTLNKAALKSLVVTAFPDCMPHLKTFAEDVMVAQCLRNKIKVFPFDTKDDKGGERYMPFQPAHHLTYKAPKDKKSDWYANYSIDIKYGLDHCSAQAVAFHYIKPFLMRRLHAILYGHCAE